MQYGMQGYYALTGYVLICMIGLWWFSSRTGLVHGLLSHSQVITSSPLATVFGRVT